jgi:ABC-type phosphate transport system ATPase subunit
MEEVIQDVFRKRDITIFLVTHDERQALRIAETFTYLENGEITEREPLAMKGTR